MSQGEGYVHLLLIEDSEKLRYHLSEGLRKLGHELTIAGDGRTDSGQGYADL